MNLENITNSVKNTARNVALTSSLALPIGYAAPQAEAATVQSIDLIDYNTAGFDILNDDNVEYNNVFLDLDQSLDNISAATGIAKNDLYSNISYSIVGSPEGDVDLAWVLTPLNYGFEAEDPFNLGDNFTNGKNMYLEISFNNLPVDKPLALGGLNSQLVRARNNSPVVPDFYAPGNDLTVVPSPNAFMMVAPVALAYLARRPKKD